MKKIFDIPQTDADKQQRVANNVSNSIQSCYTVIVNTQKNTFRTVWNNQMDLTPQQVMDAFGTKAAELFALNDAVVEFLNKVSPDQLDLANILPYKEVTLNPDGTATITTTPNAKRVALGLPTKTPAEIQAEKA